jgi:hypothetical protein
MATKDNFTRVNLGLTVNHRASNGSRFQKKIVEECWSLDLAMDWFGLLA